MNRLVSYVAAASLCGLPSLSSASQMVDADGRLDAAHPAVAIQQDTLYQQLVATLALEPGFLGVAPSPDGERNLLALYAGAAPASLPLYLVPEGWTLTAQGDLEFQTLMLEIPVQELEESGPPTPEDSVGIGPGSTLIINSINPETGAVGTGICTAGHVVRDVSTGRVYLSSAGHCFVRDGFTSTHGQRPGEVPWDPAMTVRIRVCVENCLGGASGLYPTHFLGLYPGTTRDLGVGEVKLDYARRSIGGAGPGNDFGIVAIPPELYCEIRTEMPVWRGPKSGDTSRRTQSGDVLVHYGNGVALGEVMPTKGRAGIGMSSTAARWLMRGAASPGDSGSAMNIATVGGDRVVEGEWADGVLTHIIITPDTGAIAGTTQTRSFDLAREDAGYELEIIHDRSQVCPDGTGEPVVTVVADDDPAVEYRKGWHRRSDASASGGGYHRRMGNPGGEAPTVRLEFDGNAITYLYGTSEQGGSAEVYLNGVFAATVDYAGSAPGNSPAFGESVTFDGLGDGRHEFLLVFRSGAAYVDGFEVHSRGDGGADPQAATTRTSTTQGDVTLSPLGVASRTVTVGAGDEWLSIVVEGDGVNATLLDPLGAVVGTAGTLVAGGPVGIDAAPAGPGTYVLQFTGTGGANAAMSVSRTTTNQE